jgi:hypothetical protein
MQYTSNLINNIYFSVMLDASSLQEPGRSCRAGFFFYLIGSKYRPIQVSADILVSVFPHASRARTPVQAYVRVAGLRDNTIGGQPVACNRELTDCCTCVVCTTRHGMCLYPWMPAVMLVC